MFAVHLLYARLYPNYFIYKNSFICLNILMSHILLYTILEIYMVRIWDFLGIAQ